MYERELAFANSLADRAAEIAMGFYRGEFEVHIKRDSTPVTEADLAVEAMIRSRLAEEFPSDAVLGEEQGLVGSGSRVWVVDPIDGTKNFAAGIQIWATLVALLVDGEPVLGVVGAPALGERYGAASGAGATLNGERIHVSDRASLGECLVAHASLGEWREGPWAPGFAALTTAAARTRGFGDFWGHVLVARGAADVMVEAELRTWDWAALAAVAREAGGALTQLDGRPPGDGGSVLTTNGVVHGEVLRLFRGP
ncbi:MAG TPA: inositol monophosphatase family protein [Actinomycetota bacterium]|jgi:histidinol-phosphatase